MISDQPFVQEMGEADSDFGPVLYIKIRTENYRRLGWEEVWQTFSDRYPGRWAVEVYPPKECLVNEANVYHLWILDGQPRGVNIKRNS